MASEPFGLEIFVAAMGQVKRKKVSLREPLEIAGEAGVEGIAAAEDDASVGEEDGDFPKPANVAGGFVDYARGRRIHGAKTLEILHCNLLLHSEKRAKGDDADVVQLSGAM